MVHISRVLNHDILKFIYDYVPCIARLEKGELAASGGGGVAVYEGRKGPACIQWNIKALYVCRVGLYNISPSHRTDDVFYYQQSIVHV
jgi:hypothetical protein